MPASSAYELITAVMATADAFLRESQRLFRPYRLTAAQFNVLNILAERPAGLSQRELGDLLVVDRSNVTGLLDRLEKAGWVRRADHPKDRRIYRILLTVAGRQLWGEVQPRYLAVVEQVARPLTVRQRRDCIAWLQTLEAHAGNWKLPET